MVKIAAIGLRGFPGIQGGVEMHCENIYPHCKDGIKFIVYRRKPYLSDKSNKTYPNITFIDLPSTRIKGFEAVFHTFICCLHIIFHRVDIVHIHNIGPGLFAPMLRLFGIKVVLTYHSPNYEHDKWGTLAKSILRTAEFLALKSSNRIIFVNKFQMQKFSPRIQGKSVYIANGINAVELSAHTDFINKLGVEKDKYLLAVGRLTPEKGFEYLVEAVNRIPSIPHLVIAGTYDHDASYYNSLKELDVNNKVIFSGYTTGESLRQLYSHARLFVLSSVNEGFPLVMLEAMSYHLPMIVSDIPATRLIELSEDNYFKSADTTSLTRKLEERFPLPCDKVNYDLANYSWNTIAEQTVDAYQKVLAKN